MKAIFKNILIFSMLIHSASAFCEAFKNLNYSGRIIDTSGKPRTGPVDLKVKFYSTMSGTDLKQSSEDSFLKNDVSLSNGVFNIQIDISSEYETVIDPSTATWIEIEDITNNVIYPRQQISAVPYAMQAGGISGKALPTSGPSAPNQVLKWNGSSLSWEADQVGGGSSSVGSDQIVDLSIGTGDIADDAINNDKITINAVDSTQLQDGAVTNNKLAGSITDDKLNQITTANKVHNSATTANTSFVPDTIALRDGAGNISAAPPTASEHLTTKSYVDTKVASVTLDSLAADTCNDGEIIIKTSSGWECSTMPGSGPPDRLKFVLDPSIVLNTIVNSRRVWFGKVYTDFDSNLQDTSSFDVNVGSSFTTRTNTYSGTTVTINESGLYSISFYGFSTGCLMITISNPPNDAPDPSDPSHIGGNTNCAEGTAPESIDTVRYLKQGALIGPYFLGTPTGGSVDDFSFEIIRVK